MSSENSQNLAKTTADRKKTSTIVHKPFATGEINFFRPFKAKTSHRYQEKTGLTENDEAKTDTLPSPQLKLQSENLFNVWNFSAIFILLLTNFTALGVMKIRALKPTSTTEVQTLNIESPDLVAKEFMPLNLSTLSGLPHEEKRETTKAADIVPDSLIPPAYVPFNNDTFTNQYYYVLAQYTGDRSLELARENVSNISLVHLPQGMFIYLGAFSQQKPASEFVSKLQELGIEAKTYPFE